MNQIMNLPPNIPTTLYLAAREIEVMGWCQGAYEDLDGNLSAMGAVAKVLWGEIPDFFNNFVEPPNSREYLLWHLCFDELSKDSGWLITLYNDHHTTTAHDVIDLLDLTAEGMLTG